MPEISVSELIALQSNLQATVRHEVGQARADFKEKFDAFSKRHDDLEERQARSEQEIVRLAERARLSSKGFLGSLSRKQKAAITTLAVMLGGSLLDGARHLGAFLFTLLQHGAKP